MESHVFGNLMVYSISKLFIQAVSFSCLSNLGKLKQDVNVEVSLQLTLDRLFEPSTQPTIQYGPDTEDLILDMSEKENEASTCKACNAFVMQCGVSM